MNPTPKVSVLIPSYNYAIYLDETIGSVLAQTFTDFELVIVENGSTDNSDEVIRKYLGDKRIRYYQNEKNLGAIGNFNKCLEYAEGEYIKFLLADDIFDPQVLEKFVRVMEEYPQVSLVSSERKMFGLKNKTLKTPYHGLQNGKQISLSVIKEGNWLGEPSCVMFRRKHLATTGNFSVNSLWVTEWDLWLKLLDLGDCYIFPENLTHIRLQPNQISRAAIKNFGNYIDEYHFYKNIRVKNVYHVDLQKLNIDEIVKNKAMKCSKLMIKLIPSLYHKRKFKVFKEALKIAYGEGVIVKSLFG